MPIPPITPKTALNIIAGALRLLGILQPGEVPSADDAQDGLDRLNELLDGWRAERLMVPVVVPKTIATLTPGKQTYTLGPELTNDVVIQWPQSLQSVAYTRTVAGQVYEYPITVVDDQAWQRLSPKNLTNSVPSCAYLVHTFPAQLSLWPIPNGTLPLGGVLYAPTSLDYFTDLYTAVSVQPAYLKALRYNLASDLAPDYVAQPRPDVITVAAETKKWIKNNNLVISDSQLDRAVLPRRSLAYDINQGP